jgi:hypothetical protein
MDEVSMQDGASGGMYPYICTTHLFPVAFTMRCHGSNRFDMIKAYRRHILSHNLIH